jgi:predicted metal-binding membrane protein
MDLMTLLSAFAQISIAFLGFTGLVSVLSPREWDSPLISLRLWILIEFSLGGLILSLLPMVLVQWGISESTAARGSSVAFLILFIIHAVVFLPRIAGLARAGQWPGVPQALNGPMLTGLALCLVTVVLTLAGVLSSTGGYSLGLLMLTFLTGWNFATILYVLRTVRNAKS